MGFACGFYQRLSAQISGKKVLIAFSPCLRVVGYSVVFSLSREHNFSMSFLKKLLALLRKLFGRPAAPPDPHKDPFAEVRAPVKRGPRDRSGAVALAEPDEN